MTVVTILTLLASTRYPSFALWVIYLMLVVFCCGGLIRLLHTHLDLSDSQLQGWTNDDDVCLSWADIQYARCEEKKPDKFWLTLVTQDKSYNLTLDLLDAEALWQAVQRRVPAEALAEDAAERLAKIQEQAREKQADSQTFSPELG